MPEPPDLPAPTTRPGLPLEELAARVGRYRWVEERLFELLGGWVPTVRELEVKRALAEQSHHHAWHAQLWEERLPRLAHLDPAALTVAPGRGAADVVAGLGDGTAAGDEAGERPGDTVARLVGVHRVLVPRLVAAYSAHLARTSPVSDGPVVRVLRLVIADAADDWRAGEALLQALVTTPVQAQAAATVQGRLEALLLADAGLLGPDDPLRPGTVTPG